MSVIKHIIKAVAPSHPEPVVNPIDEAILDGMERDSREQATESHKRVVEAANRVSRLNGRLFSRLRDH